jgi:hypothetical protein
MLALEQKAAIEAATPKDASEASNLAIASSPAPRTAAEVRRARDEQELPDTLAWFEDPANTYISMTDDTTGKIVGYAM